MRDANKVILYIISSHESWKPGTIQLMHDPGYVPNNIRISACTANVAIAKMIKDSYDD